MSTTAPLRTQAAKSQPTSDASHAGLLLQRKCACGKSTTSLTGECAECASKKRLQTKLTIGASNDPLELEADRVADQVMAPPVHSPVRGVPPHIQRLTAQPSAAVGVAPASVDRVLASPGRLLEPALQQDLEQRFGYDFSQVRVHTGGDAEQSARDVSANAYTVGHDIVFGANQFAPEMNKSRRLVAHELAHVVQQSGSVGLLDSYQGLFRVTNAASDQKELQRDEAEGASVLASCSFKEPAVGAVAKIIESELPHGRAGTYEVDELQTAWFHVRNQREVITNCCNAELAAAEHYFYSRYAVANRDHSPFEMKALIWGYGYFKFFVPKTGNCPKSPDTQGSRDWGYKGVDDAIRDLFFQDLAQNDTSSDEEKQAMGSDSGEADSYIGNSPPRVMQAKLSIGVSTDSLELEAERIADQVMAAPALSPASGVPPRIQRYAAQLSEVAGVAPASVDQVLASPGRPLEPALRQDMEQRFGHDFSRVRVHTDSTADQSVREVGAYAYTVGRDIAFGTGRFAPSVHEGRRLIAHELAHVVQQGGESGRKLNRMGDPNQIPRVLPCAPSTSSAPPATGTVLFPNLVTTLTMAQKKQIGKFARIGSRKGVSVRVDGFASEPGAEGLNWKLSCDRAMAVKEELIKPTAGAGDGILEENIDVFMHGKTTEFGNEAQNRRVSLALAPLPPPRQQAMPDLPSPPTETAGLTNEVPKNSATVDCDASQSTLVAHALQMAQSNIRAVTPQLVTKPLTADMQNALWIYFRDSSPATAAVVSTNLTKIVSKLGDLTYECETDCEEGKLGYTRLGTMITGLGSIHLCMNNLNSDVKNISDTIIHEVAHYTLLATDSAGYYDRECSETETTVSAGMNTKLALADSYNCFVKNWLTATATERAQTKGDLSGANIAGIVQVPPGPIDLSAPRRNPTFLMKLNRGSLAIIEGVSYRWVLRDTQDRSYLMTRTNGTDLFQFKPAVESVIAIINTPTRDLLKQRGITSATIICRATSTVFGDKLFECPVTFLPSTLTSPAPTPNP